MAVAARPLKRVVIKPEHEAQRRFKIIENERRKKQKKLFAQIRRMLLAAAIIALMCAVLYTQAQITTVQNQIERQNAAYAEEMSLYDMLMYQIESRVSLKDIEEKARQMGLVQRQNNQTVYIRIDEEEAAQNEGNSILQKIEEAVQSFWNWLGV